MIRFQSPALPPVGAINKYYAAAEDRRWYSNSGPCHDLLVERLEAYIADDLHCVPMANATSALMLGIRALAPRAGNGRTEVLLPSFTFAAVVNAVLWAGLQPVFVDVDTSSWHLCPDALDEALDVRAGSVALVIACSTFGFPPPAAVRDHWSNSADLAEVSLLIDSAAGFGAVADDGLTLGAQGDAEVFSFHATKPFAIGEGGLLTTRHADVAEEVRRLSNFGFENGTVTGQVGLNAKLAEWPAATALAVLDGYSDVLTSRRTSAGNIVEALTPHGYVPQPASNGGAWQFVPVAAPSAEVREAALRQAKLRDIELRTYYEPLHRMPAFRSQMRIGDLSGTETLSSLMLSLPMANDLSEDTIAAVVACLVSAAEDHEVSK